jgi:hypothetical protein
MGNEILELKGISEDKVNTALLQHGWCSRVLRNEINRI